MCVHVTLWVRALVCARIGTTESTERNTEKTLVKGKRPLCLPFQSNRPSLSPLSFSLCPRFGSSCSLPAKPSLLPLSFARYLFFSLFPPSLSFPSVSFPPTASPLLGFLFVLLSSSHLRLTHPEERENFAVLFSSHPPSLSLSLFLSSFHLLLSLFLLFTRRRTRIGTYLERTRKREV